MTKYLIAYDLQETAREGVESHVRKINGTGGKCLSNVWIISSALSQKEIYEYIGEVVKEEDGVMVVEFTDNLSAKNLLIDRDVLEIFMSANKGR